MDILFIIPARGGSKRIPKKNIRQFLGKEIISYPIKSALSSAYCSKLIVSTDSK
ncbi:cytidylyltransferase domain-containing protein, partial [Vibrio parahaemolyticus]